MLHPIRYAVIATHHKTGSVWMRTVFLAIGRALGIPFIDLNIRRKTRSYHSLPRAILFDDHSDFSKHPEVLSNPEYRLLHIIRDPRDVIISAMHYHRFADEPWLHEPKKGLRGQSYQEALNAIPDDRSRYLFEMGKSANRVIRAMRNWDYTRENSFECRYEALIADRDMKLVRPILEHLGIEEGDMEKCLQIFWDNSLFGGLEGRTSTHIRSGQKLQWRTVFDGPLAAAFVERFGNVLIELGYEPDNSWAAATVSSSGK